MNIKYFNIFACFCLCLALFSSCSNDDDDKCITFIGDSLIERWDLQNYFPTRIVYNEGVGGSGIDYMKSRSGTLKGKTIVVLYGTNDMRLWNDAYTQDYVKAIALLGGNDVYVFSILPRSIEKYGRDVNARIKSFNQEIKPIVEEHGWRYIDVFDILLKNGDLNPEYSLDGLHLQDHGYQILTHELIKAIK